MAVSIDQLGKSVVASGLMTADEIRAFWNALPPGERPKDGSGFAQLLVKQEKLNRWQADELLAGRATPLVMGDYVLLAKIGEGGMGQVFKARHKRMNRMVALKVMSAAAMKDEASVKRFQREVHAAARLEHPNIVTAYDSGEVGNVKYLVMQFVDGGDLSSLVKKNGPLEIEQAVNYVLQTARGLSFAHGEGVIHRDIKPANLLLDKKGVVKILDMGLARIESSDDGLTATEQVMGTVDYMSPEQAANTKGVDGRADIYSLGCTLWFLLTAKKVYEADTMIGRLMAHRDAPLPSLVKTRDDAPWPLEQAFHKMIAKRLEDRFQSMDEVVAALAPFAGGGGVSPSGMGSSIGQGSGPQSAELSAFLKQAGQGTKQSIKPLPSKTAVGIEATEQLSKAELGTDPKSQVLPPSHLAAGLAPARQPNARGQAPRLNKKKPPAKLIAAGIGGLTLVMSLGVWLIVKNKEGEEVARVAVPDGGSATVVTLPTTTPKATTPVNTPVALAPGSQTTVPPTPSSNVSFFTASSSSPTTSPTTSPPPPGDYALEFRGFDQKGDQSSWVDVPSLLLSETGPLTLETRVMALGHNEGYVLGTNDLRLRLSGGRWTTDRVRLLGFPIENKRWYHLAAVRTDGEVRMYIDGKRFDAKPLPTRSGPQAPPTSLPLKIGGNNAQLRMNEIRISKTARYDADFKPPSSPFTPDADTLALYHCDDGAGDVLKDSSGNGHDGKITKPSWVLPDGSPIRTTTFAATAATPAGVVYLDDLPEKAVTARMPPKKAGKNPAEFDELTRNFGITPTNHSLSFHPSPDLKTNADQGRVDYVLAGNYARFQAIVLCRPTRSPPIFAEVWGDDKLLWKSDDLVRLKPSGAAMDVDVRGVRELSLRLQTEGTTQVGNTLWVDPRLTSIAPDSVPAAKTMTVAELLDSPDYVWTEPENLGPTVNTLEAEYVWGVSDDETALYFRRALQVFVARRSGKDQPFGEPELLPNISTILHGAVTADGLHLAFVKSLAELRSGRKDNELQVASRRTTAEPFPAPKPAPALVTEPTLDRPVLSADGLTLLAHSVRDQLDPQADLWMFTRSASDQPFATAEKLPGGINTPHWNIPYFISNDRCLAIASSHQGTGRIVRYFTRPTATDPFGPGTEIEIPLGDATRSSLNAGFRLADGGRALYFESSALTGGQGKFDIWVTRRVPKTGTAAAAALTPPGDSPGAKAKTAAVVYLDDLTAKSYDRGDGPATLEVPQQFTALINNNFPGVSPVHALVISPAAGGKGSSVVATLVYDVPDNQDRFQARVRVRSERTPPLFAEVWGDDKRLWESGDLTLKNDREAEVDVDVRSVRELKLITRVEKNNTHAHTVWIEPRLTGISPGGSPGAKTLSVAELLTSPDYVWTAPENLGPTVNGDKQDRDPAVSADGLCLIFNSNRGGNGDLFECRRQSVNDPWGTAVALDTVNAKANFDNHPWLSADGLTLLFSSSGGHGKVNSHGGADLWQSRRASRDAPWETPVNFGPEINTASNEGFPRLSPDGLTLFFNSNQQEEQQGPSIADLWQSRRQSLDAPWEKPAKLGPSVNTKAGEDCAQPLADGKSLLFLRGYSDGKSLRLAEPAPDGGYTIRQLEFPDQKLESFSLLADRQTILFAAHRPGGLGDDDLWMTRRVPKAGAQQAAVVYLDELQEKSYAGYANSLQKIASNPASAAIVAKIFPKESPAHALMIHPENEGNAEKKGITPYVATIVYDLTKPFDRFQARVRSRAPSDRRDSVFAEVWGDGKKLWEADRLVTRSDDSVPGTEPGQAVDVDVRGVRELKLIARANERALNSHVLWIEPRLTPVANSQSQISNPQAAVVYLDDLPEIAFECKGPLAKHGVTRDGKKDLDWLGQKPSHSLYTHPVGVRQPAWVTYALDGRYAEFRTTVGTYLPPDSPLTFSIFGDDKPLWESTPQTEAQVAVDAVVDVRGVKVLKLEAFTPGSVNDAHALWIDPRLTPIEIPKTPVADAPGSLGKTSSIAERLTSPDYEWTEPVNLGPNVNTAADEEHPSVTADLRRIYFGRKGDKRYEAVRASATSPFEPAQPGLNLKAPSISADGLSIVSIESTTDGGRLQISRRPTLAEKWSPSERLSAAVHASPQINYPRLSPDGLTLYFSVGPAGTPESEIWMSQRTSPSDSFGPAVKLDDSVNTPQRVIQSFQPLDDAPTWVFRRDGRYCCSSPDAAGKRTAHDLRDVPFQGSAQVWFAADGATVFFAADLPGGLGGLDIWVTRRVPKNGVAATSTLPAGLPAAKTTAPPPAVFPFDAPTALRHQEAWAKYLGVPVEFTNGLGMKFRLIPPGEFQMGLGPEFTDEELFRLTAPPDGKLSPQLLTARPAHPVRITRPFYLEVEEVTAGRYRDVVGQLRPEMEQDPSKPLTNQVAWRDAIAFCNRLSEREGKRPAYRIEGEQITPLDDADGYRLPTEAEWEFACRAGTNTLWHFGNADDDVEFLKQCAAPNPFGLVQMYAGASEWCWDATNRTTYTPTVLARRDDPREDAGPNRIQRGGGNSARGGKDRTMINSFVRLHGSSGPYDPALNKWTGFGRVALPIAAPPTVEASK